MNPVKGLFKNPPQSLGAAQAESAAPGSMRLALPGRMAERIKPVAYGREQLVGHARMGSARGAVKNFLRRLRP